MTDDEKTVWCGNISDKVTEELLYELFLQVAPLERVRLINEKDSRKPNIAFITMKHEISVNYVIQLLDGTNLFDRKLHIKRRNSNQNLQQSPQAPPQNNEQQFLMDKFNDLVYMSQFLYGNYLIGLDNRQENKKYLNGRHRDDYAQQRHYNRHNNHNSGSYGSNHHIRNTNRNNYDRRHRPY